MALKIRPYILAGGKSSRMGRDKAMLELGGSTLLARAVGTLRGVSGLQAATGEVVVTVAGERNALEGADRSIVDRFPGCGPLGGIEAALDDLDGEADWAFFIPVDMPLLSGKLIDELLFKWGEAIESDPSVRACLVELDGRPQPLLSLVHHTDLGEARKALDAGCYKVVPVLKSVGVCCTSLSQEDPADTNRQAERPARSADGSIETYVQFANVNTEADLIEVATLMTRSGWKR